MKMFYHISVQRREPPLVSSRYPVFFPRRRRHCVEPFIRQVHGLFFRRNERLRLIIQIHYHRAVVHFIGYRERTVVVIRRAYEPHVFGHAYPAFFQSFRVAFPLVGHYPQIPLIHIRDLQHRQKLREVILHSRYIHFVQHHHEHIPTVSRFVHFAQQRRFVELFRELVVISQ